MLTSQVRGPDQLKIHNTKIQGYILVTAICLLALPSAITSMTSSGLDTNLSDAPLKGRSKKSHCYLKEGLSQVFQI